MALIDSLVSYYKMDEASGNRADAHGSNTLTDNNTVGSTTGILGNAAVFVAANSEYLSAADNTVFQQTTGNFSVSFWYKSAEAITSSIIFSKRNMATGDGFRMLLNASDQPQMEVQSDSGGKFLGVRHNTDVADNTWKHIVVTWDGSSDELLVYVNAVVDNTTEYSALPIGSLTNTSIFRIGSFPDDSQFLDGNVDEFGFWSRVLTGAEVTELYNAGAGLAYPFTGGAGGAVRRRMMSGVGA